MAAAHLLAVTPHHATFCSKASFNSRPEALRALRRMRVRPLGLVAHGSGTLISYKCRACLLFHLGHKS